MLPALALYARAATVTNTSPPGWSVGAASNTAVLAHLDSAMAGPTNFVLHSGWRGNRSGAVSEDGARLVFTPDAPLLPGETLLCSLSGPDTAFSWRFQAAARDAGAVFITNQHSTIADTVGTVRFRNLALADIDGDGTLDMVAPAWGSNAVLIVSGLSSVSTTTLLARAIQDVAVGDFNRDGRPDLLLGCATQSFAVITNAGGAFAPQGDVQTVAGVTGPLREVAVGDLTRNGWLDAVAISETSGHAIPLLNDGSGVLVPGTPVACTSPLYGLDVGDLDGDGAPDAVTVGPAGYLAILLNDGAGGLQAPAVHTVCPQTLYTCRIADFNQDGYADIAAAGAEGIVVIGYGSATGFSFSTLAHGFALSTLYGLAVGDADGNGFPDIAVAGGNSVAVLPGGAGGFVADRPPLVFPGETLRDLAFGDLNQDGRLDLVVCGLLSGKAYALWNAPASTPVVLGINGEPIASGEAASLEKGTDFGLVPVFSSATNTFQLVNAGDGLLLISSTSISGVAPSVLQVLDMPESVEPGATSSFHIVFEPQMTGTYSAVFAISNNSPSAISNAASPYLLNLVAEAGRSFPHVLAIGETNHLYDGTVKEVIVTVEPASLAPLLTLLYDGDVSSSATAGVYTVTATVDDNLYFGSVTSLMTIARRELVVVCADATRAYGEANPDFSLGILPNYAPEEGPDQIAVTPTPASAATSNSPVGPYPIIASGGAADNYSFTYSNGTLTVTQTLLTARADNQSRMFGEPNPPLTISYTGWKNDEGTNVLAVQPAATTTAGPDSPAGTYPILVSSGSALNYALFYIPGTLTVYATTATLSITDTNFVYDGTPKSVTVETDPSGLGFEVTYNGFSALPVTAGVYAVVATITGSDYSGSTNATLTIHRADQAVSAFLPANGVYPADQFLTLSAEGSPSGIPVSFAIESGPAVMVASNQLRFTGFGPVAVTAWQPAGANWNRSPALTNAYSAEETNAVHYAAQSGQTPAWPYANWASAASNIQTAVDLASAGEMVRVGPGVYNSGARAVPGSALANRLVLDKPLSVLAEEGPAVTFLVGQPGTGAQAPLGADAVRCVFMTNGTLLAGFTLINGFTDGPAAPLADQSGGGALLAPESLVSNCVIAGNGAVTGGGLRGGAATRCVLAGNTALMEGGGAAETRLANSLLRDNAATYGGGAFRGELANCTVADNTALFGGGLYEGAAVNSIAWYNTGWDCFGTLAAYVNAGSGIADGVAGCMALPPLFTDRAGDDYRLAYGSPCINRGDNAALPPGGADLDGGPRVHHAIVDLGAYEFFGTPGVPLLDPPSDIRAHQALVQWQQPGDGVRVIRFRVTVTNLTESAPASAMLVDEPALSGVATGLAPNTPYACRVRAENDYDTGGWSGWQSFTTLTEAALMTTTTLTFHATFAEGHSHTQSVELANPGATPGAWSGSLSYDEAPAGWLAVSPTGGTVEAFGAAPLVFAADATGLTAGTYTARHTVDSPNATNSPPVQVVTLHVARATDAITIGATNQVFDGTPRPVIATAWSGEPVTVTYNGSAEPPGHAGLYAVTATVDTVNWTGLQTAWLTIARAPQAITAFLPAPGAYPSTNTLALSAVGGGSGQTVLYAVVSGPGVLLSGNRLRFTDYGAVQVMAGQPGNANWLPAATVTNTYQVDPVTGLVHFVARSGQTPVWPYADWTDAASNIQDAVDAAWNGDTVLVRHGVYQDGGRVAPGGTIANRICITRPISLVGESGATATVVRGSAPVTETGLDAVRGLYAEAGAVIQGFTFTDGHTAFISDITQDRSGGGLFLTGGAEARHCIVTNNHSSEYGGGAIVMTSGRVVNGLLAANSSAQGGGLCLFAGGEALHCTIAANTATIAAGGAYLPNGGHIGNSIVWGNMAPPAAPQDLLPLGGAAITFTAAGDGVTDGVDGCRIADPLFTPGGFQPAADSPCVNAGNNAQVATDVDLKNDPRVVATIDMGAYEYLSAPAMPTNLSVTNVTAVSATLRWQPGDIMPVSVYNLEIESLVVSNTLAEHVPGTVTSVVAGALSAGTAYRWRARAGNAHGISAWTDWQSFLTQGQILSVSPPACNVGGGLAVLVEGVGLGNGTDIDAVSLAGVPADILDQGADWVLVVAPPAPAPGVGAVRVSSPTGGDLALSNAFAFLEAPAPVLRPPTAITADSLVAHWEPLAEANGYQLQVSDGPAFTAFLPGFEGTNEPIQATELDVTGLVPGTNYLRLRAWFAQGFGPYSATLAVPAGNDVPWVQNPIGDILATAGETRGYDLSLVFAGSGLTFAAADSNGDIAQPDLAGTMLTVRCGPGTGMATVTVTATHTASGYQVSSSFAVEVMPTPLTRININCGGKRVGVWAKDRGYSGGTTFSTTMFIDQVKIFPLAVYRSFRFAPALTYSFPALPNGTYNIQLAFAELLHDRPGDRVFKVKIEDATVLPRLDVLALTGAKFRAYRPVFKVVVKDGNGVQIRGQGLNGANAFFNGIRISPSAPAGMATVPPGVITGTDPDDGPYVVTNKARFYVDATEVTKQLWDTVRNWGLANGYTDLPEGSGKGANHPVQMVNWYDCVKWCNARSQMEGLKPAYYTTPDRDVVYTTGELDLEAACVDAWGGYRLPAETEWEYAARGGIGDQRFPWGATIDHTLANYFSDGGPDYDTSSTPGFHPAANDGIEPYTSPVGAFGVHGYGGLLADMAGNVAEWCWDPASGPNRAVRGGAWSTDAVWCRIAQRLEGEPALRVNDIGFRTVITRP